MAGSDDLIDFNIIESHKENIQALPSGRSAKALAQLYSPPLLGPDSLLAQAQDAHTEERKAFEKELVNIDEADDPLDVYDRYVKWTTDTYPSAQATPQSRLLPLLERATKAFQSSSHHKNDPRYLKLWLLYIRLFSDAPRETFVFLARHGIGENLALYYEEFAAWLENAGRWQQAEEIFRMGLANESRPVERLLRKFGEFERRKNARSHDDTEPTSPALPSVRPALAAKLDPFASASPSAPPLQDQGRATAMRKSKGSKMTIFSDSDESRPDSGNSTKGWENIGSLADRKKENTMEAKPWVGEKLKGGRTNGGVQKMMIFKDESSRYSLLPHHLQNSLSGSNHEQQCTRNPKTGKMECVFVNLEAVYPEAGKRKVEYCFEELRADHRGWLKKDGRQAAPQPRLKAPFPAPASSFVLPAEVELETEQRKPHSPKTHIRQDIDQRKSRKAPFTIFEDAVLEAVPMLAPEVRAQEVEKALVETFSHSLALKEDNDENEPPLRQEADLAKKLRREERANRTRKIQVMDVRHIKNETKTIQINLDSPTGPKLKRKKGSDRPEPTMTINTKEAMDEIYGIFNQPLPSHSEQDDAEEEDSDDEDDYTTGDESTGTGKLSGPPSEYGDDTRNEILGSAKPAEDESDGRTEVSSWSEFTTSKHMPKDADASESGQSTTWEIYQDPGQQHEQHDGSERTGDLLTPGDDEEPRTHYVPMPPVGYEPPTGQFRDMAVVANNRLPFMTPIVEQTESSLGAVTGRTANNDYFAAKTPSRKTGAGSSPESDELYSSPFQQILADMAEDKRKVLQPVRTKSTKGTISLGQGSAKAQNAAKVTAPLIAEPIQKGPIIKDQQCNPMDPDLRQSILSQMKPSLSSYDGYHEQSDRSSGRAAEIKKFFRAVAKASKSSVNLDKTASMLSLPPTLSLADAHGTYTFKRELGAGTFAPVYLVENSGCSERDVGGDDDLSPRRVGKAAHRKRLEAIKMEEPVSTWEFYILRQCHRRLGVSRAAESIVRAHEMHMFQDECFLVEEYRDQGTLLDLVNIARLDAGNGGGMDEAVAMWFTVELLRTTEALHAKALIHGDLKADNVLVRFDDPGAETDWSPTYFPSGAHGWSSKGVCLIDLGRGIDMKHFVAHVGFVADWKTSEADCAEMRELRPWTYQIDYHGLAGIVHSLLFGKYMETVGEKGGSLGQGTTKTYRIRESLKRYWQTEIWTELFQLLLNPLAHLDAEPGRSMPVLTGMRQCRERMECWLEENCERGVGLKGTITRMECAIRERRRKVVKSG